MGSYVEGTLIKDEKIIYEGKTSIWSLLPLIVLGFIFIGFFGIGILFWIAAALRYITTELAFTNKRVIAKFGFISRRTIELNLTKVESVQVNQGILGRVFLISHNVQPPSKTVRAAAAWRPGRRAGASGWTTGRNDD